MNFKPSDMVLLHGDPAVATFDMLEHLFIDLRPELEKAKLYARSSSPILIEADTGPVLEMLGQAIHNGSDRKGKPYTVISYPDFQVMTKIEFSSAIRVWGAKALS